MTAQAASRWWVYQRERFPLLLFTLFIAAVCFGVLVFSSSARGAERVLGMGFPVAVICTLIVFLQLRIADEFKDYEDDAAARPYRPVPRGLVTLSELRVIGIVGVGVQIALTLWLSPKVVILLMAVLVYLGLMAKEFFVPVWLKARPVAYLLSHQVILPLIYLYISACDWLAAGSGPPPGLLWILCMGYCSGMVVEIGRKIRAPEDEEEGVETYSVLWGPRRAIVVWLLVVAAAAIFALMAARIIGAALPMTFVVVPLSVVVVGVAHRFISKPVGGAGQKIDTMSGMWTVLLHAAFGLALIS